MVPHMRGLGVVLMTLVATACGGQTNGSPGAGTDGSGLDEDATAPPWDGGTADATDAGAKLCTVNCNGLEAWFVGACPPVGPCASTEPPSDASTSDESVGDDDAGPCSPGQTFCLEGCSVAYPTCVVGACPPPPPCPPPGADTICPDTGQRMCQPCLNVTPSCVDIGVCLPAKSCPASGADDAGPACAQGQQPCPVDCLGDYLCLSASSQGMECPPVCGPPAEACDNGICVPMR